MEKIKEKPILFSGAMVRAILEGRKTMTRRVIKEIHTTFNFIHSDNLPFYHFARYLKATNKMQYADIKCPYQIGQRLWVRETWITETEQGIPTGGTIYKATDNPEPDGDYPLKWRPSIFMPRWASRINLEVTDIKVERLQEIREGAAQREGWDWSNHDLTKTYDPVSMDTARQWFKTLWDSINGKKHPWSSDPWVWCISFKVKEAHGKDTAD
jgi:hypothetical protein